jgi:hypothetical protein
MASGPRLPVVNSKKMKGMFVMATSQTPTHRKIPKFGWIPDLPDVRDHVYSAPQVTMAALPASVDMRPLCPPVYDQGQLGSCTGNAIAGAIQFDRMKQRLNRSGSFVQILQMNS